MAVEAWIAETVDGGDENGSKKVMSGITVKLSLNHCPNYVGNHWRIIENVHLGINQKMPVIQNDKC